MPESFPDQLSRVRLMAQQRPSAYVEMLPEDLAALTAVLESRDETTNEIKSVLMLMDSNKLLMFEIHFEVKSRLRALMGETK